MTALIIGARTLEQLEDNIGASGWELTTEQVEELSEASALEDVYPYRFIRNAPTGVEAVARAVHVVGAGLP